MSDLFNSEASRRAADEGERRATEAADEDWMQKALYAGEFCCQTMRTWTTDDIWKVLASRRVPKPREPKAMAGVVRELQKRGRCRPTDEFRAASMVSRHSAPMRVWESLLGKSDGGA